MNSRRFLETKAFLKLIAGQDFDFEMCDIYRRKKRSCHDMVGCHGIKVLQGYTIIWCFLSKRSCFWDEYPLNYETYSPILLMLLREKHANSSPIEDKTIQTSNE